MSAWHINPFPAHGSPVDWTGKPFSSDDLKYGDFWRIGRMTVEVRSEDFHIHIDDVKAKWACGKTVNEAIGSLVSSHPEILQGPPILIREIGHLIDEANLDSSAGSYCEVSRDTLVNIAMALAET